MTPVETLTLAAYFFVLIVLAIYGWHRENGVAIQPLTIVHKDTYVDYSHGIRLVSRAVWIAHFQSFAQVRREVPGAFPFLLLFRRIVPPTPCPPIIHPMRLIQCRPPVIQSPRPFAAVDHVAVIVEAVIACVRRVPKCRNRVLIP